jgi:predicted CxxxxCH...CXXCH cytochrome family protein
MGASAHPASEACNLCHSTTVGPGGELGAAHRNGVVDVTLHAVPFTGHGAAAISEFAGTAACTTCHGAAYDGGEAGVSCTACHDTQLSMPDWQTNCTFCHGTRTPGFTGAPVRLAAPPQGVNGETLTTDLPVGAHQKHLGNGSTISDGVACGECHAPVTDLSHLNGAAAVAFGGLASQGMNPAPWYTGGTCSSTYCHGTGLADGSDTTPSWTGTAACGSCHGSPPTSGQHTIPQHSGQICSRCHSQVATNTGTPGILNTPAARALHVDGSKSVSFSVSGTWT